MVDDDVTLQELIVRALTGRDEMARRSMDSAAASDPELQKFCDELQDIVGTLAGSSDWRALTPSSELTARIRQAVVAKLPAAPPHFRTVLLEADLGRRRAARRVVLQAGALLIAAALVAYLWQRPQTGSGRLDIGGRLVYQAAWKGEPLQGFSMAREEKWESTAQ